MKTDLLSQHEAGGCEVGGEAGTFRTNEESSPSTQLANSGVCRPRVCGTHTPCSLADNGRSAWCQEDTPSALWPGDQFKQEAVRLAGRHMQGKKALIARVSGLVTPLRVTVARA